MEIEMDNVPNVEFGDRSLVTPWLARIEILQKKRVKK